MEQLGGLQNWEAPESFMYMKKQHAIQLIYLQKESKLLSDMEKVGDLVPASKPWPPI